MTKPALKELYCIEDRTHLMALRSGLKELLDSTKKQLPNCDVYIVGGAVRDLVLCYEIQDVDFVAVVKEGYTVEEVTKDLKLVGKNFQIALIDGYEVAFTTSLEEDYNRRDFTINSMYLDFPHSGRSIFYGPENMGLTKQYRLLEMSGDIAKKITADPIRILRALRFMAKYKFDIELDLHYELHRYRHLVKNKSIPADRIYNELRKGICCGNGYRFIQLLDEYELLEHFFPALYAVKGIDGAHYHNETVYTHCINALCALDYTKLPFHVKMAALYHDVGKVQHEISEEGKVRFTNHAKLSRDLIRRDLNRLKFPNEIVKKASTLVREHMDMIGGKKSLMKLVIRLDQGGVTFKEFIWHKYADSKANMKSHTDFKYFRNMYKEGLKILNPKHIPSVKDLEITGHDVMLRLQVPQGKLVGQILNTLWEDYLNGEVKNDFVSLLFRGEEIRYKLTGKRLHEKIE